MKKHGLPLGCVLRNKNLEGKTVMKRCASITCDFDLAIEKVNLNKIVYRLKELGDSLMLRILKQILKLHNDLIMDKECFFRTHFL